MDTSGEKVPTWKVSLYFKVKNCRSRLDAKSKIVMLEEFLLLAL